MDAGTGLIRAVRRGVHGRAADYGPAVAGSLDRARGAVTDNDERRTGAAYGCARPPRPTGGTARCAGCSLW
jgi:hypothetical protein